MFNEIVDKKISEAMKSKNEVELSVWRAIKTEIMCFKTAKEQKPLTDEVEIKLVSKLIAQHKDSVAQFTEAGRMELAEKEQKELDVLIDLLPKEPTDDEIKSVINEVLDEIRIANGGSYVFSMKDMKTVQANVRQKFPNANGGKMAEIFKKLI